MCVPVCFDRPINLANHATGTTAAALDNDVRDLRVQGVSLAIKFFDTAARIRYLQQRPVSIVAGSLPELARGDFQVHNQAPARQHSAIFRCQHNAATSRKDEPPTLGQVVQQLGFATPKTFLTLDFEDGGNGYTGTRDELLVAVQEVKPVAPCVLSADSGLSGAHHSDKDDGRLLRC